jgi:hypothetical protein
VYGLNGWTNLPELPRPKLPQSRRYLRAARWGFDQMVERHLVGTGFILHVIGIVTMLRAIPFALYSVDRGISVEHRAVIDQWWQLTASAPEIKFIKRLRDTALKDAALKSTAVASSTYIGDGPTSEETSRDSGVDHIDLGERRDLLADLRSLFDWFEVQLSEIEARVPDHASAS